MEKDILGRADDRTEQGGSFATAADDAKLKTAALAQARTDVVDTNAEEVYWRQNFTARPYVVEGSPFIEYRPAYRYGADAHTKYPGKSFEQAEPDLMREWDSFKGTSSLTWDNARHAARDAWQRVSDFFERATPGDSDNDGK